MKTKTNLMHLLKGAIMAGAFLLSGVNGYAVNPCEMNTSMTSGQAAQNGGTHDISGTPFNYEMWTNSGNNASMEFTANKERFQFKANWNNPDDLLCRIGLYWGNGPKPDELDGDLHCDFNYSIGERSTGGGYNYIGIYGWTKVPNEVEYYIVENTFFGNTIKQEGLYYGANKVATYTIAGEGTYDLYIGTRYDAPSVSGKSTFTQVFAVNQKVRFCGHISVSEHMRKWKQHVTLGNLYDCKFLMEVGAGSGSFDLKYGNVWMGDADNNSISFESPAEGKKIMEGDEVTFTLTSDTKSPVKSIELTVDGKSIANMTASPWSTKWTATAGSHEVKATATLQDGSKVETSTSVRVNEPQAPYKSAFAIPGTIEAEDYDKGGPGEAYNDSDEKNEGDAKYRTDEFVDIVKAGDGMAVGYTSTSEWLEYTINVEEDGDYDVEARMSCGSGDPAIDLSIDGKSIASLKGSGVSNDWNTYSTAKGKVSLKAGEQVLKVSIKANNTNLDYIKFTKVASSSNDDDDDDDNPGDEGGSTVASGNFFDENGAYFGPECESTNYSGAYYTGDYTSPFKTILGKTDEEIQAKLDQLWNHYFKGNDNSKVYYDQGNEAYIYDTGSGDVRSEGMSYGMMICVQTNHKEEFAKIWNWAKNHMWHNPNNGGDGYFSWSCNTNGTAKDQNCAPDGEMYFMTSLLLAANRWNESQYMQDAQAILKSCWKGNMNSLFNESEMVITFQPSYGNYTFSDPSYDLPAFLELFSRWSNTNKDKWSKTVSATRDHLYKSCNTSSGLFTDYNYFNGQPKTDAGNSGKYMYDAMRCAMNYGMDYYLFGKDAKRQEEMARRIIDFFEKDGYKHARFNWDGSGADESYTLGETGANAVACYALMGLDDYKEIVKKNLSKAWNADLMTGQYRYYDGLVHYLSMLHLCGSFKIWKSAPSIEEKTVEGEGVVTYQGVEYTESTTITAFDDCQLYNVTIDVKATTTDNELTLANKDVVLMPNPATDHFEVKSNKEIVQVELLSILGQTILSQSESTVSIQLPSGTYLVRVTTADGEKIIQKLQVR